MARFSAKPGIVRSLLKRVKGDPAGWLSRLKARLRRFSARREIARVLLKLMNGVQTDQLDPADLHFCYRLLLGRRPDRPGWNDWMEQIRVGKSREALVDAFLASDEYIERRPSSRSARVVLDDFVIYVDSQDPYVGQPILRERRYEPNVTDCIKKRLRKGMTLLDVGANIGWFTLTGAVSCGESGKVFAIEPSQTNLQLLYRSLAANRFTNVTVFPYAASDSNRFFQLSTAFSNAAVRATRETAEGATLVQAARIDELLGDRQNVDLIKIDIEGHEPAALRGMRRLLERCHPVIASEFSPKAIREGLGENPEDFLASLRSLGYRLSVIESNGNELELDDEGEIISYWDKLNRKLGTGDTYHLDILAV